MEIFEKIAELKSKNRAFAVATIVDSSGSVPGKVGFRIIVCDDGSTIGTVGGGAIELEIINECKELLSCGEQKLQKYILSKGNVKVAEDEKVIPMMCNGKVQIFFETFGKKPLAYIFGGGHVGSALLKILPGIGYHNILIDNREEFANEKTCPGADEYNFTDYEKYVSNLEFEEDAYIIILTHGHSFDYKILKILFERKVKTKYIGAIASKAKAAEFKRNLKEEFGENLDLSKLHTPIGLKIGGSTADEIAISIAGELQSVRYEKKLA